MNLSNYARNLELAKYRNLTESLIQEADANPEKALEQVKSGKNGGSYKPQWDQLVKAVHTDVDAGKTSGMVMIKHDNGTEMVSVSWSIDTTGKVTLSTAKGSTGGSGNWDANKFLNFNANGKLYEVVSAMITVCIEKLGKDWGPNHVAWVKDNLNKAANGNTSCVNVNKGAYANLNFLRTDGTVRKYAVGCSDAPTQIVNNKGLNNAGDAKDLNALNAVVAAIKTKLDETWTSSEDEYCMISCYEFISPKISQEQIEAAWQNLGMGKGGPLSAIVNEKDTRNDAWGKALGTWALGARLGNANPQAISACGLDKAAHDAAVVAIRAALS